MGERATEILRTYLEFGVSLSFTKSPLALIIVARGISLRLRRGRIWSTLCHIIHGIS